MISGRRVGMVLSFGLSALAVAQQGKVYTDADYAQAEKMLAAQANPLVYHAVARVDYLKDGRFWYRDVDASGGRYLVVDATGKKSPAFDEAKMVAGINAAGNMRTPITAGKLMVSSLDYSADGSKVMLGVQGRTFTCGISDGSCTVAAGAAGGGGGRRGGGAPAAETGRPPENMSPDGTKAIYIQNWNLWVRDVKTGEKKQLTTDGVENYGYATDNAGWKHTDNAIAVWSPDGTKVATFQQDQRKDGDMFLVTTEVGHPKLQAWKYPLPGDENVSMLERVVIDVTSGKTTRLKTEPDQHRSTNCDDINCGGTWSDVMWTDDGKQIAYVATDRGHHSATLKMANPETGEVRTVFNETVKTWFQSGQGGVNWHVFPKTNEFVWWSQRSNWGHLYMYDLTTGKVKYQITSGDWNVTSVRKIDEANRVFYFMGVGKEKGDPYYQYFYKVGFDGKGLTLLTPGGEVDHAVTIAKDNKTFVDTYSTATEPPVTVLRSAVDGKVIAEVSKADITALKATGWVPPTPIKVKARDGKVDLYGYMFKPSKFDASKKYPIVNNVYPGPQTGSCGARTFAAAHGDRQALAELGFIVVCIDGQGTPWRSKAFHDFYYGNMSDNTLPDQVAGMKDLAKQYPFIDLDRAGMWGHSGGGNATSDAMFLFPDFFKVGISESGNHDQRNYEDDWGERYQGLLVKNADGTSNYTKLASDYGDVGKLKGHLLLAHGTIDDNVPPYETLALVDALVKANKSFDLIMLPNMHHGYAQDGPYMMRRRWDYFVTYLAGGTPPVNYQMKADAPAN